MDGGRGLWVPYTIAAGTYPGQKKRLKQCWPNFLAVNVMYQLTTFQINKNDISEPGFPSGNSQGDKGNEHQKSDGRSSCALHPGAANTTGK